MRVLGHNHPTSVRLLAVPGDQAPRLLNPKSARDIRKRLPAAKQTHEATARARAASEPTRYGVMSALAEVDELCGADLAVVLSESRKLISHHLKVLREAGLVESRRAGKYTMFALGEPGRALLDVLEPGLSE
jgi:ArsR family transcriptional regulator, lead/cadmium/zinc/bismuth-responsive transcriptional repressor